MESRLFMVNVDKDPVEARRIAAETASRIESKEVKLLELVKSIGEYLTDDDNTVRAKAIGYLAAVLGALGPKSLTRQQVPVVTQFLCDRLEDEAGLKETAAGLTALSKMQWFGNDEAKQVASVLCKVDLPKHPPTTRFTVLTLLDSLMSNQRDALKDLGDRFITGLADLVGGEKDPRNLMVVFSVVKVVLVEFDIVTHTELMFDITYCYFPITFRPPPDDPYGITAQGLKSRLRECIASTKYFAGQVFPALIEKLDSTSQSVKMDVLQTMTACALSYGPQTVSTHSTQLWDAVKYEILNATGEDELANEALQTVKAIASTLSFGLNTMPPAATPLARYLKMIVKECLALLQEPQQKQAKPASLILATVATASVPSYAFIVQGTMPALMVIYTDADAIPKRRALMEALNQLFESNVIVYGSWTEVAPPPLIENPLLEYKDKFFEIYPQVLMGTARDETTYRLTAMRGLGKLCKARRFFEDSEIGMVVQYLDEIALEMEEKGEVREEALQHLRDLSKIKSQLIMQITFPAFMAHLPDSEAENLAGKPYIGTLEALAKLSFERPVFEVLLTRLLNKLDVVLHGGCGPTYPRAILSTLLYGLKEKPQRALEDTKAYYARLVPPLLTKTIVPLADRDQKETISTVLSDELVLEVTGRLVNILLRSLDIEEQASILQEIFDLFVLGAPSRLINDSKFVSTDFRPFDEGASEKQAKCVIVFACALAAVKGEVSLPVDGVEFLQTNIALAKKRTSSLQRVAHLRIISCIVNKWIKPKDTEALSNITSQLLNSITSDAGEGGEEAGEKLRILFWITKALILRADKLGMELVQGLVELLGNNAYGSMAGRGFAVLFGEDEFLNKENHAIMRMLARQRTFSLCIPKIVEGFQGADAGTKPNYLVALSNILRNVPSAIITPELPRLLPLLLQSVDLADVDVKAATIETLNVTIRESADCLKEHVSSVITRLLGTCIPEHEGKKNPPKVRTAALRCLQAFPGTLRGELLLPYKRQVLRRLLPVLDDPKRVVRKEAVDCRARWFALDEPEE